MVPLHITIVVDNPDSWIIEYAEQLRDKLNSRGHDSLLIFNNKEIPFCDIVFFLGCEQIVPPLILAKNKHNLVVHESLLPKGKGWSPLTWQILEGENKIPITLIEAVENVDAGQIYKQDWIILEGHELIDEIREYQGSKTIDICLSFIDKHPNNRGQKQEGSPSYYPRRTPKDSEIDPSLSILENFNQLRVADNNRYPVHFFHKGNKYYLKVTK